MSGNYYKYFVILIFLFGANTYLSAQPASQLQWQWAVAGGASTPPDMAPQRSYYDYEYVHDMTSDGQGNIYMFSVYSGNSSGSPSFDSQTMLGGDSDDLSLISLDCQGNLRWKKEFGNESVASPMSIDIDAQDNLYISGQMSPTLQSPPTPTFWDTDFQLLQPTGVDPRTTPTDANRYNFVVSYDSSGNFRWIYFPTSGAQDFVNMRRGFLARDLVVEPNGTVHWMASIGEGTHLNGNITVPAGAVREWVVLRLDTGGSYLGHTVLPGFEGGVGSTSDSTVDNLAYDPVTNTYFISSRWNGSDDIFWRGQNLMSGPLLVALDATTGIDRWMAPAGSTVGIYDIAYENGSLYLSGGASSQVSFMGYQFTQQTSSGATTSAPFAMALDAATGTLLWGSNPDSGSDPAIALEVNGTEVALATSLWSTTWDGLAAPLGAPNSGNPALVVLDRATGTATAVHQAPSVNTTDDSFTAITSDQYGNYTLGGYNRSILFGPGSPLNPLGKRGPADFMAARAAKTDCNGVPLSEPTINPSQTLNLYPNPSSDNQITVGGLQEPASYVIYDLAGRMVQQGRIENNGILPVNQLKAGSYLLTIDSSTRRQTLKLLRE